MNTRPSESEAREILGVGTEASFKDIKKAHKALVRLFHPDRAAQDLESQSKAHESMSRINGAWLVIEERQAAGLLGQADSKLNEATNTTTWSFVSRRPNEKECGLCGSSPARTIHIQGVVSVFLAIGWPSYNGSLCKSCALAVTRDVLRETMTRGWWGIGVLFTPFLLIHLAIQIIRIEKIPEPTFRDYRVVTPYEIPLRAQKSPLKQPLPMAASAAALVVIVVLIHSAVTGQKLITSSDPGSPQPTISTACWTAPDASGNVSAVSCDDSTAVYQTLARVTVQSDCPVGTTDFLAADSTGYLACLGQKT